jgi:predicted enzyme related to lactoylglutathione lyase
MAGIERIGNIFYRVEDLDAAVDFYSRVLGLSLKLRDGDRWAAFDVAGVTLALEATNEAVEGHGGAVVSLGATGLDEVVAEIRARGGSAPDPVRGPHERRVELRDPSGNLLFIYEPLPPR